MPKPYSIDLREKIITEELYQVIAEAVDPITPVDAQNCFHHGLE